MAASSVILLLLLLLCGKDNIFVSCSAEVQRHNSTTATSSALENATVLVSDDKTKKVRNSPLVQEEELQDSFENDVSVSSIKWPWISLGDRNEGDMDAMLDTLLRLILAGFLLLATVCCLCAQRRCCCCCHENPLKEVLGEFELPTQEELHVETKKLEMGERQCTVESLQLSSVSKREGRGDGDDVSTTVMSWYEDEEKSASERSMSLNSIFSTLKVLTSSE